MKNIPYRLFSTKTSSSSLRSSYIPSIHITKNLPLDASRLVPQVYKIAADAGLNPDQFCKIRNGCFKESDEQQPAAPANQPLRGLLASTKVSELLGVKPVFGEGYLMRVEEELEREEKIVVKSARAWYHKVGDYLENPHRHFKLIDELRETMDWPDEVKNVARE